MDNKGFIPGLWEEEINVNDFLKLNTKAWKGQVFKTVHELFFDEDYDVLKDENQIFTYLVPFHKEEMLVYNKKRVLYLEEEIYEDFTETIDRKKFLEMGLIVPAKREEKWAFIQPEICIVPLYGTKTIIRTLKQYLKDLDKQFQTQEWIHRKISHQRSILAIQEFEEFALRHGVNVRRPSANAREVANTIWLVSLFVFLENPEIPFSFQSVFNFLDTYIERDIKQKKLKEREAQQLVDELYCKLAALKKYSQCTEIFNFSITIVSSKISNTIFRLVESALEYGELKIPFQLICNNEEFPKELIEKIAKLFNNNHPIAISQSLRKRDVDNFALTASHTFFRNYEDITMFFASFDLEKALLVALNGGKDIFTNANLQQVTKPLASNVIDFDNVLIQFEAFLKYYITVYAEYINSNAYYYDMFHDFPFRQSLISSYPYYLMNLVYHNVSSVVNLLTAIYDNSYEIKTNSRGYIEKIVALTNKREEFIGERINEVIHNETNRMLFYKNGHHNIVFFTESPSFETENKRDIDYLSPKMFPKTSFSRFQMINYFEFESFLNTFINSGYTHVRIHKK